MGLFSFLSDLFNSNKKNTNIGSGGGFRGTNTYNTNYSTPYINTANASYSAPATTKVKVPVNNATLANMGYSTVPGSGGALINPNPLAATKPISNPTSPATNTSYKNMAAAKLIGNGLSISSDPSKNVSYTPLVELQNNSKQTSSSSNGSTSSGSSSSSGGGTVIKQEPIKIDLSDILAAYTKSAEAQKKSISDSVAAQRKILEDTLASRIKSLQTSESTQRENLLTSLKRFQEDTAQSRKQQQSSFNANRADLEAQAFMANRAAMQSAAARGLGGSGLQQLAQIQNMINQSGEINELAIANTDALNALAQAYARQEQDTNTNISNLARDTQNQIDNLTTEQKNTLSALISQKANSLNEIETNTTSLKEQLKYQEAVRAENARIQAEQFAANLQVQNAQIAANQALYNKQRQEAYNDLINSTKSSLAGAITNAANQMKTASTSSKATRKSTQLKENNAAVQAAYDQAIATLTSLYAPTGLDRSYLDEYMKQLDTYYGQYYQ